MGMSFLPFGLNRRVLPILTLLGYPLIRREALANLLLAYGDELDAGDRSRIVRKLASNLGLLVAEQLALMRGKLPDDYLDCSAADPVVLDVLQHGRGAVLLSPHSSNWEMLAWWCSQRFTDRERAVIADRVANPQLQRLVEHVRNRSCPRVIYQDESIRRSLRILVGGGIIGSVPDQDVRKLGGVFVDFFGHPAYTPTGPAAMSYLTGAPIIVMTGRRTKHGITMTPGEPIWPDKNADKHAELLRLTDAWSQQVEAGIRRQPSDWMWFHRRWRTTPDRLKVRRARLGAQ